jgi:hypothetical protein
MYSEECSSRGEIFLDLRFDNGGECAATFTCHVTGFIETCVLERDHPMRNFIYVLQAKL